MPPAGAGVNRFKMPLGILTRDLAPVALGAQLKTRMVHDITVQTGPDFKIADLKISLAVDADEEPVPDDANHNPLLPRLLLCLLGL